MADIRRVTEDFSVAPQIAPEDMDEIARQGFRLVVNNRPDGESPDQPSSAAMAAAAERAGLSYAHIPVVGMPRAGQVAAMAEAVKAAQGPVFAFCRSGTRSITTWAIGQAQSGGRSPQEIAALAAEAGYDLRPVLGVR